MLSVLAAIATSGVAQATTVQIKDVVTKIDDLKSALTADPVTVSEGNSYIKPVVWESGAVTAGDGNTLSGYKADITTPLYVREGTLKIEDSELTSNKSTASQALISVAGNNAHLEFSHSKFINTNNYGFMLVGGPDGSGSLTVSNNSEITLFYSLCAGFHKNAQWTADIYVINSTTATNATDSRYEDGDYLQSTLPNGQIRDRGKGTINVNSGSTLQVGSDIFLAEAELNIDNAKVNTGANLKDIEFDVASTDANFFDSWSRLGRQTGTTTNVNITNGGVWEIAKGHLTSGVQDLNGTTVNIKVDGEASALKLTGNHGSIALGIGTYTNELHNYKETSKDNKNTTNLTISNSGLVSAKSILLGVQEGEGCVGNDTVNVKITGAESTMRADEIVLGKGASVVSEGIISGSVSLNSGASLTLLNGAETDGVVATGGTFSVLGDVELNGNIALSETGFIFADGVTIDLKGKDFSFADGAITIVLDANTPAVVYNAEDQATLAINGITFTNAGTVAGFDGDIENVKIAYLTDDGEGNMTIVETETTVTLKASDVTIQGVPEPTTATLSLLALAGLAMRRRRH